MPGRTWPSTVSRWPSSVRSPPVRRSRLPATSTRSGRRLKPSCTPQSDCGRNTSRTWAAGKPVTASLPPTFTKEAHMFHLLKKLVADDAGQDLAEYGIALAVIGALAAGAAVAIAGDVNTLWSKAQAVVHSAV